MKIEKYITETSVNRLRYTFESIGIRVITKIIVYTKIPPYYLDLPSEYEVYNLGFGDWNEEKDDFDDKIESNNGDTEKVLATVANTTIEFWEEYPEAYIYFRGSQPLGEKPRRTRLYQMGINRYFTEINPTANIFGLTDYDWEAFEQNKNYNAFLISKK
jgi:hypothetical protein